VALFNSKIKLFVQGRKQTIPTLKSAIKSTDKTIWVHVASLGEYEQGLPIIEKLKSEYPSYKIVVTFFSPSGYEVKKNSTVADVITYLPMDSQKNVDEFLDVLHPSLAIFVKYEIWPNYVNTLHKRAIPAILISAIFTKNQIYFKSYGNFMRKALGRFSHYFVQNDASKSLLSSIGISNITVCGDTRLDRVYEILERDNTLDFMEAFKQNSQCFVAGSTWPEDEEILIGYINQSPPDLKFVIAPHKIQADKIKKLTTALTKKTVLYSKRESVNLSQQQVLIIDHIGLLTRIYRYADFAYVGGGFATGLHNTLEPAVFGIPILIGPNYKGFQEAEDLVRLNGILPIADKKSFQQSINRLLNSAEHAKKVGEINYAYINKNKGASVQIMQHIRTLI